MKFVFERHDQTPGAARTPAVSSSTTKVTPRRPRHSAAWLADASSSSQKTVWGPAGGSVLADHKTNWQRHPKRQHPWMRRRQCRSLVGRFGRGADASNQRRASDVPTGLSRSGRGALGPRHREGLEGECAFGVPAGGFRRGGVGPQLFWPAADHSQPAGQHPPYPRRQPGKLSPDRRHDPHAAPVARQRPAAQRRRGLAGSAADNSAGIRAADDPDRWRVTLRGRRTLSSAGSRIVAGAL